MTRLPSLTVRLVPAARGQREAWAPDPLAEHLSAAGHRVQRADPSTPASGPSPDVVHCFGIAVARDVAAEAPTVPLLVTPSDAERWAGDQPDVDPLLAARASAAVRSSDEQAWVHGLGVPWFRTWVLPPAVDVDTFTRLGPMANRTDRFRLVIELSGEHDGAEDVLVAVAKLDEVELVVLAGGGDASPEVVRRAAGVRELSSQMGVSERLVLVVPESAGERAWWLRSAHVAVAVPGVPSAVDFVAEAMACGTPVVATRVDALADLVVHGVTGFHVPVGDPLSLARAVRLVLGDDFTVESYGLAAADRALSRFAWPRVTHELVGVYRRVAAMDLGADDPDEEADDPDAEADDEVVDDARIA